MDQDPRLKVIDDAKRLWEKAREKGIPPKEVFFFLLFFFFFAFFFFAFAFAFFFFFFFFFFAFFFFFFFCFFFFFVLFFSPFLLTSPSQRRPMIQKLHGLMKTRYCDIILKHDASRIVQTVIKFGFVFFFFFFFSPFFFPISLSSYLPTFIIY